MPTGAVEVQKVRQALEGRYRIERVLGEGGMATVYLAEDLKHHRQVAVKVMRPELAETLGAERFLREVEIAARLNHQNILPVFDSGAAAGVLYYVMPLVEGESLPARIAREGELPVTEALRLAREVAEALAHAHKRGIIHRDIKPANILVNDGHALVSDFGIARATSEAGALTQTGIAIGTPAYMSPEQASGEHDLDGRTDIYALGCVLYEMLTGEPPFTGRTAQAIIARSITEDPRPLTRTRPALAPVIDSVVLKALAKQRSDRYADANAFVEALSGAETAVRTGEQPSSTRESRVSNRNLKPWMLGVAAVLILALGAAGMKFLGGGEGKPASSVAVLPFENQGSTDDAYFADGIVDELRDRLARLGTFTVIASSSADQYRDSPKPAVEIAKELQVGQVLTGKVRWATNASGTKEFKVTTEMVDAHGHVTWRDSFDGDLADPFAVQGQIATRVATALGAVLADSQAKSLAGRPTDNARAYDLFLRAKAVAGVGPSVSQARVNLLEQSVALDPNFAAAWIALSEASSRLYYGGYFLPADSQRARVALDRAMTLAPDSAATHLAAEDFYRRVARDPARSRREVARALELEPDNPVALLRSANGDLESGDDRATLEKLLRAREIDPRSTDVLTLTIRILIRLGRYEDAVEVGGDLLALAPTDYSAMENVAIAHVANGDLAGAQRVVADLVTRVPPTELVAYFAMYEEMAFVLPARERELLFRLTPAAINNDIAWWGQTMAVAAWQQGDTARARLYADSTIQAAAEQVRSVPSSPDIRSLYAVSLAILGRKGEALTEAARAVSDTVGLTKSGIDYVLRQQVRVLIDTGEQARALDAIEALMRRDRLISPGFLRVDPMFRSLKGNPRFERLANRGIRADAN